MTNNQNLFNAAISGGTGGGQARWLTSPVASNYQAFRDAVEAFATSVDVAIPVISGDASAGQMALLAAICQGVMTGRLISSTTSSDYDDVAAAIAALFTEMDSVLTPGTGGTVAPLSDVFYVDVNTANPGQGSIAAPYPSITAAIAGRLPSVTTRLTLRIAPGNYEGEDPIALTTDNHIAFVGWVPDSAFSSSPIGASVQMPTINTTTTGHGFGAALTFANVSFNTQCTFGAQAVYFYDCFNVNAIGTEAVLKIMGGTLAGGTSAAAVDCYGVEMGVTSITVLGDSKFVGCDTLLSTLNITADSPVVIFYDTVTKANANDVAPAITGTATSSYMGFPLQSITGVDVQDQVNAIIAAGVELKFWADNR